MSQTSARYRFNPDDPVAPSTDEWEQLDEAERKAVEEVRQRLIEFAIDEARERTEADMALAALEAEKATVEAEKATVEAEKATVEAEKLAIEVERDSLAARVAELEARIASLTKQASDVD